MQPNEPYVSPPPAPEQPPASSSSQPDYSFLEQQPKKTFRLPIVGNSLTGRILSVAIGLLLIVIVFVIIKSLLATPPFTKSDYLTVVERQQEMLHILNTDVTSLNTNDLTTTEQNFVATANTSLATAQSATLTFMKDYRDKVNSKVLADSYSNSIDQDLSSSLSSNSFSTVFNSIMSDQLSSYQQELKTAYSSTHSTSGKSLLRSEYSEAKLLVNALGSPTS